MFPAKDKPHARARMPWKLRLNLPSEAKSDQMTATIDPPDFVVLAGEVLQLTPEEIRLAKRDSNDPNIILSLDKSLCRLLFGACTGPGTIPQQELYHSISQMLHSIGYLRMHVWHSSSLERLIALTFIAVTKFSWRQYSGNALCKFYSSSSHPVET